MECTKMTTHHQEKYKKNDKLMGSREETRLRPVLIQQSVWSMDNDDCCILHSG